jgi:hypothetical protein
MKEESKSEWIICSAIWYKSVSDYLHEEFKGVVYLPKNIETGFVVCGRRHHNIIQTVGLLSGQPTHEAVQGFLTNLDRFVDRKEGLKVALEANQVINKDAIRGKQLYSEDLY